MDIYNRSSSRCLCEQTYCMYEKDLIQTEIYLAPLSKLLIYSMQRSFMKNKKFGPIERDSKLWGQLQF